MSPAFLIPNTGGLRYTRCFPFETGCDPYGDGQSRTDLQSILFGNLVVPPNSLTGSSKDDHNRSQQNLEVEQVTPIFNVLTVEG
jgi:hypothetical protein